MAFGQGWFVAVGALGTIMISADGENWQSLEPIIREPYPRAIAFGGGRFMVVTAEPFLGSGAVVTSEDGLLWRERLSGNGLGGSSVVFGDDQFLVSGVGYTDGGLINATFTAVDGLNWT